MAAPCGAWPSCREPAAGARAAGAIRGGRLLPHTSAALPFTVRVGATFTPDLPGQVPVVRNKIAAGQIARILSQTANGSAALARRSSLIAGMGLHRAWGRPA